MPVRLNYCAPYYSDNDQDFKASDNSVAPFLCKSAVYASCCPLITHSVRLLSSTHLVTFRAPQSSEGLAVLLLQAVDLIPDITKKVRDCILMRYLLIDTCYTHRSPRRSIPAQHYLLRDACTQNNVKIL